MSGNELKPEKSGIEPARIEIISIANETGLIENGIESEDRNADRFENALEK
ncbi:hypothetical protein [Methanosarcina sp. MSH10X1]|uniref:hypothetical protein n=1 Tax=Methanosarcina sp. MSH10X1 TaxID=2507075 RepID=UPI0013E2DB4F|nr:hypothetical protein [Methanosarcina sp. MSH10X1]